MVASTSFTGFTPPTHPPVAAAGGNRETQYDAALVQRFHAGDETAFVEIVTRYRAKMFSVAFSRLRNRADAEEIAQDTFIRAHRGLANFRGDSALATWLYRIALNLSRNRYWYHFRRSRHTTRSFDCAFSDDNESTIASLVASSAPSPVEEATTTEFSELVTLCMGRLGSGHREILTLRNILNRSYDDIGRALGINVGTVKSRIARARENLRTLLAKACPEFPPDSPLRSWIAPARACGRLEVICA